MPFQEDLGSSFQEPAGDEIIAVESSAEDQDVDDLATAEHHSQGKYLLTTFNAYSHVDVVIP
jgi:hypothetical protein